MTHQPSFAQAEFATKQKITRREKFLTHMETLIPWTKLLAVIEPFYPKGQRGRPPIGLERMLRVYFLQQWSGLADEALEDALYDSRRDLKDGKRRKKFFQISDFGQGLIFVLPLYIFRMKNYQDKNCRQ